MIHGNPTQNDQIAGGSGPNRSSDRQGQFTCFFFNQIPARLYSAATSGDSRAQAIFQNRHSKHRRASGRLSQPDEDPGAQKSAALFDALPCPPAAAKKRAFDRLLTAIFQRARQLGLLEDKPEGAIDATGLENRHTSQYYVRRSGYKCFLRYSWPKLTAVCETATHLFSACRVSRGPGNDSSEFIPAMLESAQVIHYDRLLADAAYDGEHNHQLCREVLGIRQTMIPLNPRRGEKTPKGRYRRQMKTRFFHRVFGQRWQIESAFSRHKRRLGAALYSRTDSARKQECYLRVLTHNLMILGLLCYVFNRAKCYQNEATALD